jgi:SAM-dependent methyltransferase
MGTVLSAPAPAFARATPQRKPDVAFVPTPTAVVDGMLRMAKVTSKDVVYDLGCGDGRIVIAAARLYGARGVGIDIDPERIEEARAKAREAGVTDLVSFRVEDLFETDISEASVVTLYLLPVLNLRLRQKLWRELEVGSRVVSHVFDMGLWEPDEKREVRSRNIYLWYITEETKSRLPAEERRKSDFDSFSLE